MNVQQFYGFFLKQKENTVTKKIKLLWKVLNAPVWFKFIFSESRCTLSLQVATKWSINSKKTMKTQIFRFFSKAKTVECDQNFRYNFDQCGITMHCSTTYFLEVGARVLLKVATKWSITTKKTLKIQIFRLFF